MGEVGIFGVITDRAVSRIILSVHLFRLAIVAVVSHCRRVTIIKSHNSSSIGFSWINDHYLVKFCVRSHVFSPAFSSWPYFYPSMPRFVTR